MFKINNKFVLYLIDIELDLLPDLLIVDSKLVTVLFKIFLLEVVVFFNFDDVLDNFEKLVNNFLKGEIIFLVETKEEFKIEKLVELIVEIEEELEEFFVVIDKTEELSMKEFVVILFSVIASEFVFKVVEKVKIFLKLEVK